MGQATFCCELSFGKTESATPSPALWEKLESRLLAAGLTWSDLEGVEPAELAELLREMDLGLTEREQILRGLRARFAHLPARSAGAPQAPLESKLSRPIRQPSASMQAAQEAQERAAVKSTSTYMDAGARGQPESAVAADEGPGHQHWQTMPAKLVHFGDTITEEASTGASSARECREVSGAASTPAAKFSTTPLAGNPNHKTLTQTHQGMKFRPWKPPSIVLPDDL